jgi:hypothetical protein
MSSEINIFGFKIQRATQVTTKNPQPASFVRPTGDDAIIVAEGGALGHTIDMEGNFKSEAELILRYRSMAIQPEVEPTIDDIMNESVVSNEKNQPVDIVLDSVDNIGESTKKKIVEEFDNVLSLLDFREKGYDIFKRWYIDGRIYYHKIIDTDSPAGLKKGIQEIRYIDPRKIKKIIEQKIEKRNGVPFYKANKTYYLFNEKGFQQNPTIGVGQNLNGIKISEDLITYVNSGVYDYQTGSVLSHLHKAIKPFNQVRMLEDAVVIYRLARAPERRIFYIDVGNLPKVKAEQYVKELMTKHKNKLTYDAITGEVRDTRKFMTMLEDYWLPRRDGGKGTEITTLPGGQSLGEMEDVDYFKKKLLKSLNVPDSRIEDNQFTLGRATEISRDEVKFSKFVSRLRTRFSELFLDVLRTQLLLKKIVTPDEWELIRKDVIFDWVKDNFFSQLKDNEVLQDRLNLLGVIDQFVGSYYSKAWVRKNLLHMDDEEIEKIEKEIKEEEKNGEYNEQEQMAAAPGAGGGGQQQGVTTGPGAGAALAPQPAAKPAPAAQKKQNGKVNPNAQIKEDFGFDEEVEEISDSTDDLLDELKSRVKALDG